MELTEERDISFDIAINDILRGCVETLWVNRLAKEWPEMYLYALRRMKAEYPEKYEWAIRRIKEEYPEKYEQALIEVKKEEEEEKRFKAGKEA
jgi:hypothetical protein